MYALCFMVDECNHIFLINEVPPHLFHWGKNGVGRWHAHHG
jgi:hypothetical protein